MATDARINTGLPTHPKTVKLCRRLGDTAGWNLVQLILFAASQRPDGDLGGLTNEDLEISSGWKGDIGHFVQTLVDLRWLDGPGERRYRIHDWAIHNPYAAAAPQRSERAKKGQLTRDFKDPELVEKKLAEWKATQQRQPTSIAEEAPNSYLEDHLQDKNKHLQDDETPPQDDLVAANSLSPAPTPSPSPSPTPSPIEVTTPNGVVVAAKAATPACPHQAIIGLWHEVMPELPRIREWSDTRQSHLQARWRAKPERQTLDWWEAFFTYVRKSDFLMGRMPGRDGGASFKLTLPWLLKPENFAKATEGNYHK
jgi:hypothetical protein